MKDRTCAKVLRLEGSVELAKLREDQCWSTDMRGTWCKVGRNQALQSLREHSQALSLVVRAEEILGHKARHY